MEQRTISITDAVRNLTVYEAKRWLGATEQGGNNSGQLVEIFQKAVDGVASREPWCMAYVQSCVIRAEEMLSISHPGVDAILVNALHKSEHCMTVWAKTPAACRIPDPKVGAIVIWRHGNSTSGHTGIVMSVLPDGSFYTAEGNTGSTAAGIVREGDGVYKKLRSKRQVGTMILVGFIDPWMLRATSVT